MGFVRKPSFLIILLFGLLAVLVTLPLLLRGNDVLLGDDSGTSTLYLWSIWWPGHALADNHDLVYTDYAHYPVDENLLTLLSLPTSLFYSLLYPLAGPYLSYHLLLPLFLLLNASLAYYFLKQHVQSLSLAALGAGLLTINPVTWASITSGNLGALAIFWLLLALISVDRLMRRPNAGRMLILLISLYGLLTTNAAFTNLLLVVVIPYALYRLPQSRYRTTTINQLLMLSLLLAGLVAMYPLAPFIWSTYSEGYHLFHILDNPAMPHGATVWAVILFIGLIAGLIMGDAASDKRFWGAVGVLSLLMFMQPNLAPLALLDGLLAIPVELSLSTSLFIYPAVLSVTLLMVNGLAGTWQHLPAALRAVSLIIGAALIPLVSGWQAALPVRTVPHYAIYDTMASEPESYAIMTYPLGFGSLTSEAAFGFPEPAAAAQSAMFWHGKRFIGGMTSSPDPDAADVYDTNPLMRISAQQSVEGDPVVIGQQIRDTAALWRIGYMLIDVASIDSSGLEQWLTWTGAFCPIGSEGDISIWRADWHPDGCEAYQVDIGAASDRLSIGEGWQEAENWGEQSVRWSDQETSTLSLWVRPGRDYTLSLNASSPIIADQTVSVSIDGLALTAFDLASDWGEYTVPIAAEQISSNGLVTISLTHERISDQDGRTLTAAYDWLALRPSVTSAASGS